MKNKTEIVCVRNAHYKDTGETDAEGNKLKVFVEARYIEKEVEFFIYEVDYMGEVHQFSDLESAKKFEGACK